MGRADGDDRTPALIGAMRTPEPILVVDLFPLERAALLDLLDSLEAGAWERETACPGWAVRDIAAHLVGDDLGRLSRIRDGHRPAARRDREDLVAFVNRQNAQWVQAMGRLSPAVLTTLLRVGGRETQAHVETLDPLAIGGPVSWATGDDPAPVWLTSPASSPSAGTISSRSGMRSMRLRSRIRGSSGRWLPRSPTRSRERSWPSSGRRARLSRWSSAARAAAPGPSSEMGDAWRLLGGPAGRTGRGRG